MAEKFGRSGIFGHGLRKFGNFMAMVHRQSAEGIKKPTTLEAKQIMLKGKHKIYLT